MSDKTCGQCRFLRSERDRHGRGECYCNRNHYWPHCGACKSFEEKFACRKKVSRIIIVMLCFLAALLLVAAAAVKLKIRQSELLVENYVLKNENSALVTENIMLTTDELKKSASGDQECLE